MTLVKMCGITREADVKVLNTLCPDFTGFVFWEKSKRLISKENALRLSEMLNPEIKPVGVFLNPTMEEVMDIAGSGCIKMIQLHGDESESFVKDVQNKSGLPVIRAFKISTKDDLDTAISTDADLLMLDGGAGEGRPFDWSILDNVGRPYLLAGGLTPENVGQAISKAHPYGVDVSTGIETDGLKDPAKMKRFMTAVNTTDDQLGAMRP